MADYYDYLHTLHRAEARKQAKLDTYLHSEAWHTDPMRYLDEEDYLKDSIPSVAYDAFRSSPPSCRPQVDSVALLGTDHAHDVPLRVFMDLFMQAWEQRGKAIMSQHQRRVWDAYQEAQELGVLPSLYIADELGISRRAAAMVLKRIVTKISVTYAPNRAMLALAKRIKQQATRDCALCGTQTPDARYALCGACHKRFFIDGIWGAYSKQEIESRIQVSNDELWKACLAEAKRRLGIA